MRVIFNNSDVAAQNDQQTLTGQLNFQQAHARITHTQTDTHVLRFLGKEYMSRQRAEKSLGCHILQCQNHTNIGSTADMRWRTRQTCRGVAACAALGGCLLLTGPIWAAADPLANAAQLDLTASITFILC